MYNFFCFTSHLGSVEKPLPSISSFFILFSTKFFYCLFKAVYLSYTPVFLNLFPFIYPLILHHCLTYLPVWDLAIILTSRKIWFFFCWWSFLSFNESTVFWSTEKIYSLWAFFCNKSLKFAFLCDCHSRTMPGFVPLLDLVLFIT